MGKRCSVEFNEVVGVKKHDDERSERRELQRTLDDGLGSPQIAGTRHDRYRGRAFDFPSGRDEFKARLLEDGDGGAVVGIPRRDEALDRAVEYRAQKLLSFPDQARLFLPIEAGELGARAIDVGATPRSCILIRQITGERMLPGCVESNGE